MSLAYSPFHFFINFIFITEKKCGLKMLERLVTYSVIGMILVPTFKDFFIFFKQSDIRRCFLSVLSEQRKG